MDILRSAMTRIIDRIMSTPAISGSHEWMLLIKTPTETITPLSVDEVHLVRHYTRAIGDSLSVKITLGAGDYAHGLYPARSKLKACLIKTPLGKSLVYSKNPHLNVDTLWYDAHLYANSSPAIEQNTRKLGSREQGNLNSIIDLEMMLVDPALDAMRKSTTDTIIHNTTGAQAIRAVMSHAFEAIKRNTGRVIKGVDLAPGYNPQIMNNIRVPAHTPLVEVFRVINTEVGGIYGAGLWAYLQGSHYFLYPPYDSARYGKAPQRLTCVNVSGQQLQHAERTWMKEDGEVFYLSTGESIHQDFSEREQLNEGNAVRFLDPVKLFDDYVKVSDNRAVVDQSRVANEFTADRRPDGLNIIKHADRPITSRGNVEASKLALRSGFFVQTRWDNANPELIIPGMPCRYLYLNTEKQVMVLHGSVVGVQARDTPHNALIRDRKFTTQAAVTLFLNRKPVEAAQSV